MKTIITIAITIATTIGVLKPTPYHTVVSITAVTNRQYNYDVEWSNNTTERLHTHIDVCLAIGDTLTAPKSTHK